MFKRSLASLAVVAVASGAVVAPANAMTVTVNEDMTCTIEQTDEEAKYTGLARTVTPTQDLAAHLKKNYGRTDHLSALEAEIEKVKKKLDSLPPNAAERGKLTSELEEKKKRLTANKNIREALEACIAGNNYDSSKSVPNNPGDSNRPSVPKQPEDS
ncbi:hypothetical protein ACQQ68_08340, partial [Corynebacterium diphtheriae]